MKSNKVGLIHENKVI